MIKAWETSDQSLGDKPGNEATHKPIAVTIYRARSTIYTIEFIVCSYLDLGIEEYQDACCLC